MKHFLTALSLWSFAAVGPALAQHVHSEPNEFHVAHASRFKRVPFAEESAPAWAQLMYEGQVSFQEVVDARDRHLQEHTYVKDIHERNFKHWLIQVEHLVREDGSIQPVDQWAQEQWTAHKQSLGLPQDTEANWIPIGPIDTYNKASEGGIPVSWQCNVYCFDQCVSSPDVCVAGIEGGDLFKTNDRGLSWYPVTESVPGIRTVRSTKIAPSDASRIYFEANQWLYATADGGATWSMVHNLGEHATQIAVHPTNPGFILVSAWNGLHRSTDGGQTWSTVFSGTTWDVGFHPTNPNVVYSLRYDASLNRCVMHRSDDGGLTFALKDNGYFVPSDPANASADGGRLGLTPADPDRVYVALIGRGKASDTGWIGMYQSLDRGDSWANLNGQDGAPYDAVNHPSVANGNLDGGGIYQGFYDFDMAVSHNDPDLCWVGVTALSATYDGGATWQRIGAYSASTYDIGWIHPDIQDLCVVGNDVWVATDGGLNYSQDDLTTHESRKRGIYNSTFWGFGQGWNVDLMVGGRYHNGNMGYISTYNNANTLRLGGAEAATGYVHPIGSSGRQARFSDITDVVVPDQEDGNTQTLANLTLYPNESYVDSRNSELVVHPLYGDQMLLGNGSALHRSMDGGNVWEVLMDWGTNWTVYEIEQGRLNPGRLYVVVRSGGTCKLFRTTNGGGSWGQLSSGLPTNWGSMEIALNPADINDIWAMQAGGTGLRRSTTGGTGWTDMTNALWAGESLREIIPIGGEGVLVFSDQGVYAYENATSSWTDCSSGIPAYWAPLEGAAQYAQGVVRIADKGKGIWQSNFPWAVSPQAQPMTASPEVYCALDTVSFDCHSLLLHEGASWAWSFDPEPLYVSSLSERRVQVIFGGGGAYDVGLTVVQADGLSSQTMVPAMVQVGEANQCQPDGLAGQALNCQGNPQHALTHELGVTTNTYTAMAWVRPNGIQPDYTGLVLGGASAAGLNVRGGNELGYHWPGGAWWWSSGLILPENEWSHVAIVVSPSAVKLYLNGMERVHNTNAEPVAMGAQWIGSYRGWASRNFNGQIDEVKIWNRSLTLDEVRAQRHLTLSLEDVSSDPDLLGYFQFNESASFLVNKLPSSLHGTYSGGVGLSTSQAPVGSGEQVTFTLPASGSIEGLLGGWDVSQGSLGTEVRVNRLDELLASVPNETHDVAGHWLVNAYASSGAGVALSDSWTGDWTMLAQGDAWSEAELLAGMSLHERGIHETGGWVDHAVVQPTSDEMGGTASGTFPLERQWVWVKDYCGVDSTEVELCPGEPLNWNGLTIATDTVVWYHEEVTDACDSLAVLVANVANVPSLSWEEVSQGMDGILLTVPESWQVVAWSLNGTLLPEASENSLLVTMDGNYSVTAVHAESGCLVSFEALVGCPGDVNGDLTVGVADVLMYLTAFGCAVDCGVADLNGDGAANTADLLMILSLFGTVCI